MYSSSGMEPWPFSALKRRGANRPKLVDASWLPCGVNQFRVTALGVRKLNAGNEPSAKAVVAGRTLACPTPLPP